MNNKPYNENKSILDNIFYLLMCASIIGIVVFAFYMEKNLPSETNPKTIDLNLKQGDSIIVSLNKDNTVKITNLSKK